MDPKLLLLFKLLDFAALGYEQWLTVQPRLDELRLKLKGWAETGTGPTFEEFKALNESIDADIAFLKSQVEEVPR